MRLSLSFLLFNLIFSSTLVFSQTLDQYVAQEKDYAFRIQQRKLLDAQKSKALNDFLKAREKREAQNETLRREYVDKKYFSRAPASVETESAERRDEKNFAQERKRELARAKHVEEIEARRLAKQKAIAHPTPEVVTRETAPWDE